MRRLGALVLALALAGAGVVLAPGIALADTGTITGPGPLTTIGTSPDLNCSVNYNGDNNPEFYGNIACATLISVGGTLYGPANIPAGSSASPRTPYTPVSQTGPTGSGTPNDPYRIVTVVDAGTTGVRLTQTDTYVLGQQSYTTVVDVANLGTAPIAPIVYRAGDCFLADSDYGLGEVGDGGSVACKSPTATGRVAAWVPLTAGSKYYEAGYNEVWRQIGSQQEFPSSCLCDSNIDNGAGLSWLVQVGVGVHVQVAHRTAFAAGDGALDRDGDGLLDEWETKGLDVDGNGTVDVDLPAMGASPDHKDVFVEDDYMVRPNQRCIWIFCWGRRSYASNQNAMDDIVRAFATAPVTNPDNTGGVRMHLDSGPNSVMNPVSGEKWGTRSRSNEVAYAHDLGTTDANGEYQWADYNALKAANFDPMRADVFHYAVNGDIFGGVYNTGIAQGIPGDSLFYAKGAFGDDGPSRRQESGTFMHELGHELGLHHGGGGTDDGRDVNYKPNYESIMNYSWQFDGRALDYSRDTIDALDENALNEGSGVRTLGPIRWQCGNQQRNGTGGAALDWNCSGGIDNGTIATDVTNDNGLNVLQGHEDWSTLSFDGGAVGAFGASDINDQTPPPASTPVQEKNLNEIRAVQPLGAVGDGSVTAVGPTALFANTAGQSIQVDVHNVGPAPADYDVTVTGAGNPATTRASAVPADRSGRVAVPVDTTGLTPGTRDLTVTLTAPGSTEPLATDILTVTVPDLTDPAVRDAARDAQNQLSTPQAGLDERVRTGAVATLATAVGPTAPAAPTGVGAVPGNGSATVTWTPPADTSRVTGYVVTAAPGGATAEVTGPTTRSATVPGLANGTAYTFSVAAKAGTVTGAASTPSAPVTPVAPPAPKVDHVTATINGIGRPPLALRADGDAPLTGFASSVDPRGAILSLRGAALVPGDGTTYDVRVNLARRTGVEPLFGLVTITDTRTRVTTAAIAPWPNRVTATVRPDGARTVALTLPGLRQTGRSAQAVQIGLTVIDR